MGETPQNLRPACLVRVFSSMRPDHEDQGRWLSRVMHSHPHQQSTKIKRHVNMLQTKEQDKSPETNSNETVTRSTRQTIQNYQPEDAHRGQDNGRHTVRISTKKQKISNTEIQQAETRAVKTTTANLDTFLEGLPQQT